MTDISQVHQMDHLTLAQRCMEETQYFYHRQSSDDRFCLELFRRAIVERMTPVWDSLIAQYRPQIEAWVRRVCPPRATAEDVEDLVADAITRYWRNYNAAAFARATCLAEVLRYWQDCARSAVFDWQRRSRRYALNESLDELQLRTVLQTPAREVEERSADQDMQRRIWETVSACCQDSTDVLLVRRIFMEGDKPQAVFTTHPALFESQLDVYRRIRNLKERLRRSSELQLLAKD